MNRSSGILGLLLVLLGMPANAAFITFGASVTNLAEGPVSYSFLFGTPIAPGFYNFATSTGTLSLTGGPTRPAAVTVSGIYPAYISGYGSLGGTQTNLGVDLGTAPCNAGATSTVSCDQGSVSNSFPPTFFDALELLLTFDLTGLGSAATWSGTVTLEQVPTSETPLPPAALLFGSVLIGYGALDRKRRRSRAAPA